MDDAVRESEQEKLKASPLPAPGLIPGLSESPSSQSITSSPSSESNEATVDDTDMKWEHDILRDVLNNVNQTLRFQIQMAIPLLAACVTVLNIVPPQAHQELLNDLDRWVFIPVVVSMVVAYRALEFHWYSNKKTTRLTRDVVELYKLVRYKHHMIRGAILLQGLGLVLLMVFVLLEYK